MMNFTFMPNITDALLLLALIAFGIGQWKRRKKSAPAVPEYSRIRVTNAVIYGGMIEVDRHDAPLFQRCILRGVKICIGPNAPRRVLWQCRLEERCEVVGAPGGPGASALDECLIIGEAVG